MVQCKEWLRLHQQVGHAKRGRKTGDFSFGTFHVLSRDKSHSLSRRRLVCLDRRVCCCAKIEQKKKEQKALPLPIGWMVSRVVAHTNAFFSQLRTARRRQHELHDAKGISILTCFPFSFFFFVRRWDTKKDIFVHQVGDSECLLFFRRMHDVSLSLVLVLHNSPLLMFVSMLLAV